MIDHASAGVSDYQKSKEFYTKLLAPLGYKLSADMSEYGVAGFGEGDHADFWIGVRKSVGLDHTAFAAKSKEMVDAFHAAGIAAGGQDNGTPGYRKDYTPGYYAAFVRDLDGNN